MVIKFNKRAKSIFDSEASVVVADFLEVLLKLFLACDLLQYFIRLYAHVQYVLDLLRW